MSSFGVLPTGFLQKTLEEILEDIQEAERSTISNSINTLATSVVGQFNGIVGEPIAQVWEVAAAIHAAQALDSASGAQLDNIGSIVDAVRLPATKSTVSLLLNVDDGTIVPSGSTVSVGDNGARFVTLENADNTAGAAPVNIAVLAESFEFGPIPAIAGSIDTIQSNVSGWTQNSAITSTIAEPYAPVGGETLDVVVDGATVQTVTLAVTDTTAALVAAAISAQVTSPPVTSFDAATFVRIETDSVSPGNSIQITGGTANALLGFDTTAITAMNQLDANPGADLEIDADFRTRVRLKLAGAGAATLSAIRAAVLQVARVDQAFVLENPTNATQAPPLNLPPHSFEVVVQDTFANLTEQAENETNIANAIFEAKCAGIETYGQTPNDVSVIVTDSQGFTHTINFTRSGDDDVYVDCTVRVDVDLFADAQEAKDFVSAAIVAEGNKLNIGESAIYNRMKCSPFDVDGVLDVPDFFMDLTPTPTGVVDLDPSNFRNRLAFDTSRVTVTTIPPVF